MKVLSQLLQRTKIIGTGRAVPEKIVTNYDLEKFVDTTHDWIVSRTGIEQRHVADENTSTSDLATEAAKKALVKAGITAEELDLIIVATSTPDYTSFPSTACIVQENIGATKAGAFDLEAACSGFLYGMTIADQFIKTGMYKYVLVIGAEVMTKILNWEDRNTCVLFGDGAGAAIFTASDDDSGILSSELGSDGAGGKYLIVPAGGSRTPASNDTVDKKLHSISMDGPEVFKFAVRTMGNASKRVVKQAGLSVEEVDFLVPHQANIRIITNAAKRLNLDMDKVMVNLEKYANTSGATIPIALDEAIEQGRLKKGDNVVFVGFGAGLTWGAAVMKW